MYGLTAQYKLANMSFIHNPLANSSETFRNIKKKASSVFLNSALEVAAGGTGCITFQMHH